MEFLGPVVLAWKLFQTDLVSFVTFIIILVVSFFLHSFTGTVTPKMLEEEENVNAIRQLTEQFDEVRCWMQNIT